MTIHFKSGYKHQLYQDWEWDLSKELSALCIAPFHGRYYKLFCHNEKENLWRIVAYEGCAWDGVTMFPDWIYLFEGSMAHDILLWLIEQEVLLENANREVDREFGRVILARAPIPKIGGYWTLKTIAKMATAMTHLVKSKKGTHKDKKTIQRKT